MRGLGRRDRAWGSGTVGTQSLPFGRSCRGRCGCGRCGGERGDGEGRAVITSAVSHLLAKNLDIVVGSCEELDLPTLHELYENQQDGQCLDFAATGRIIVNPNMNFANFRSTSVSEGDRLVWLISHGYRLTLHE